MKRGRERERVDPGQGHEEREEAVQDAKEPEKITRVMKRGRERFRTRRNLRNDKKSHEEREGAVQDAKEPEKTTTRVMKRGRERFRTRRNLRNDKKSHEEREGAVQDAKEPEKQQES
ncbi:hypothetical protein WMY93_024667 [Mugilogobius chulae]|uniref:Uncharacterized protein n=1 Tax=Mugilogobius chulae TaxID=88201 RepID=A0AAW0NBA3_9GOBI